MAIADVRYLHAALDQVVTSYGTMASYIHEGLGLSLTVQARLRERLVM